MKHQMTFDQVPELVVDNFAGGGGASTGIALAIGRSVDIAINHDPQAIAMHRTNHPTTRHYCESVWDVDPLEVTQGQPVGLGWFSPDCTHHSKARGGKPRQQNIRGLAWVAVKWAALVRFRAGMLENVEEFQDWGPLDDSGQPIPERKGETFVAFIACLTTGLAPDHPAWPEIREALGPDFPYYLLEQGLGYQVEWRQLRACDYGAPTIRRRLFIVMRCDGKAIMWPEPTHGDPNSEAVTSGRLKPWRTAAEIIDWTIPCPSIFDRERPLAENTLRRIARGIQKFVIENPQPFIIKFQQNSIGQSLNRPLDTVMAGATRFGLVAPFLTQYHTETTDRAARGQSLENPIYTLDTSNRYGLVTAYIDRQFTKSVGHQADAPLGTVTAAVGGKSNLVAAFLAKHYGGNYTGPGSDMDEPVSTITTVDHNALVTSHMIKMYGTNVGSRTDEPLHTVTAGGFKHGEVRALLIKYYGASDDGQAVDEPLHTVTAKARFGLITIEGEDYQIVDIGMRMLEPRELFNAQGFPADYKIERDSEGNRYSKAAQVARCGNAVPPVFAEALVKANQPELCRQFGTTAAYGAAD